MKKLFLSFVMTLMAAGGAWAQYYAVVDGVRYKTDGYWSEYAYVVAPETGTYSGEITIQASVSFEGIDDPKTVKEIGPEAFKGSSITKVTFPATMVKVGESAFEDCASLATVILNEGLKDTGYYGFKNCTALQSISLPASLDEINGQSFQGTGLTTLTIPGTIKYVRWAAFRNCTSLTSVTLAYTPEEDLTDEGWYDNVKGLLQSDDEIFSGCTSLTDVAINRNWYPHWNGSPFRGISVKRVTVGEHVTTIYDKTFQGMVFESFALGANVTQINDEAFQNCTFPTGYTFPFSRMKKIGNHAFEGCSNMPAALDLTQAENIGDYAFQNCTDIESITIGGGSIGTYAFYGCNKLSSITLNEGVTEIGQGNFSGLTNLATVNIPSTVKKIGGDAFYNCENLTIPSGLPNGLEEIGSRAFYYCKKLNVHIPATLTRIEQGAFQGCESLTEIAIPAGITTMEGYTFSGCTGLTSVTIPGNVTYIGYYDFGGCENLREVKFEKGESTLTIGGQGYAFSSSPCTTLYINRTIKANDNYNFRNTETVTFGPDCTEIGERLFEGATSLKKVIMPDNIKRIGENAFSSAMVEGEFTLSKKLETIGRHAFSQFQGFTSLTLPITVTQIGEGAFHRYSWYEQLNDIYVPWLTPLELEDDNPENETTWMYNYTNANMTLWVPGGTMDLYKAATIWKKFPKFDFWSYVVKAAVTGKGSLKLSNGEAVTDNGTNTEKTATNNQLVETGVGEAVSGLFVREKDLVLTPKAARGYKLKTLTAGDGSPITAVEGIYKVANLLADQTLSATFAPIIYNIVYDLAGGTLPEGMENPATYTVEDAAITLVNPAPREGYDFLGWTGTGITEPTAEVTISAGSIGNRKYTAVWKPIVYTIIYDLAGGTVAEGSAVETYTIETPSFTLVNPTKKGYTFTGWTGTGLTEETIEVTIAQGSMGDRSYTATWKANTYTVRFMPNGGVGEMADMTLTYNGDKQPLTANAFTRTGHTFTGWNSKADGTGNAFADQQEVRNLTSKADAVVKLYAQWQPLTYAVTISPTENGTVEASTLSPVYGSQLVITAIPATGFHLKQLTVNGEDVTDSTVADDSGSSSYTIEAVEGDVTVAAVFEGSPADVNKDGVVDVADIASVISVMAAGAGADPVTASNADVNKDGVVDVADIASVITRMAELSRMQKHD